MTGRKASKLDQGIQEVGESICDTTPVQGTM